MTDQYETSVDLPAPVEEVFRHLTDPAAMVRWMGQHATLTPAAGGTRLRLVHRNLPARQAPMHGTGWTHFLARLAVAAAGADPGPDPWDTALRA